MQTHSVRLTQVIGTITAKTAPVKATVTSVRAHGTNTLDALAPYAAPFAARWDAEANRRALLRTPENLKALMKAQAANTSARSLVAQAKSQRSAAKKATKNLFAAERRSAKTADKAARAGHRTARADLKAARRNYPLTLRRLVAQVHAAHAAAAGLTSYVLTEQAHALTVWPGVASAGVIAAQVGALALGRRVVTAELPDGMTADEKRLAARLDPAYWAQNAEERGLGGTLPTPAELTTGGLVSHVRLDARWTPKLFKAKSDEIRAFLGVRTDVRMEIVAGSHGDRARLTLRTRSASDGISLKGWARGDCWAIDTVTGEMLPAPLGKRTLIAGTSGSGKSASARPLLAEASEHEDHRLVIFDRKYIEARNWEHRARTAVELDEMSELVAELLEEGERRLLTLPRGQETVPISAAQPRITVFVDEMGELIADCAVKYVGEDGKKRDHQDVMAGLRTIARKYRAAEIVLVPATQKPTLSGDGHGLDSQIAGQMTVKLGLAVASQTDSQTIFGRSDWPAHDLPMGGYALLFDQELGGSQRRNPIKLRFMTAEQVIALPDRPIWSNNRATAPRPVGAPAQLRLVKDAEPSAPAQPAAPVPAGLSESQAAVLGAVRAAGRPVAQGSLLEATGLSKGAVSKAVKRLTEDGYLVRGADGLSLPAATEGEVSA
ncbi:tra protein [Streptomyces sp. SPB78]|uniref:MarR family transcriptional regulator n=1 Tax=Streptomyces sp. (strain SPB78) TaxID=591157 RepID=UPI0001B54A20|nr:helix-turn-helix domain-containing protein [Streptomyces sp. SPB78]EFL04302.1 tra protein [Streptomyces sp. SPB78]